MSGLTLYMYPQGCKYVKFNKTIIVSFQALQYSGLTDNCIYYILLFMEATWDSNESDRQTFLKPAFFLGLYAK